ncbi:MAG: DUF1634 domain-containing protein [Chloroflexi bacterium]|nr:DUF1634 domain-containing protein [Chloroflexota bacterium]
MSTLRLDPGGTGGRLESTLGRVLQIGTYASIVLVAIGVVLLVASGRSPLEAGALLVIGRLLADVAAARPEGFLWLGILAIVATPGLRVLGALIGFARGGERVMAIVALLILGVVALGVLAGLVTG